MANLETFFPNNKPTETANSQPLNEEKTATSKVRQFAEWVREKAEKHEGVVYGLTAWAIVAALIGATFLMEIEKE